MFPFSGGGEQSVTAPPPKKKHKPARKTFFKTFLAFNPSIQHNVKSGGKKKLGEGKRVSLLKADAAIGPFLQSSLKLSEGFCDHASMCVALFSPADELRKEPVTQSHGHHSFMACLAGSCPLPPTHSAGGTTELLNDRERSWFVFSTPTLSNSEGHTLILLSSGRYCPKRLCLLCHLSSIYKEGSASFPAYGQKRCIYPQRHPILQKGRIDSYLQGLVLSEVPESWPWDAPLT